MIMEDKLLMTLELIRLDEQTTKTEIEDALILIRLLFPPTMFHLYNQPEEPFDLKNVHQQLATVDSGELWMIIGDEWNECSIQYANHMLTLKCVLTQAVFSEKRTLIEDYLQVKMSKNGLFAYLRSYEEYLYNNTEKREIREIFESKEETKKLPKMKGEDGETVVDCNQLPGYDLFYQGLCLTSCWQMYYSKAYYRLIPQSIFLDVQQVEKIEKLSGESLKVQLYRDPFNWKYELNTQYQQYYRDQLGFDHIAWDNGVGLLKEPFIEYAYSNKSIQTVQYQNQKMQPTNKKNATFFVTRSYDILQNTTNERRVKGSLNAQAFFPWVDEQSLRMMTYKIINPEVSLDEGIRAYSYYIREYLEIDINDERYPEYMTILRIYIPDEALAHLPIDELKATLGDVKMSRPKKRKGTIRFDLKKNDNHLRVVFLGYRQLKQLNEIQKA